MKHTIPLHCQKGKLNSWRHLFDNNIEDEFHTFYIWTVTWLGLLNPLVQYLLVKLEIFPGFKILQIVCDLVTIHTVWIIRYDSHVVTQFLNGPESSDISDVSGDKLDINSSISSSSIFVLKTGNVKYFHGHLLFGLFWLENCRSSIYFSVNPCSQQFIWRVIWHAPCFHV